jgi:predicted enzyme related to lactoylglutathione lyase
MPIRDTRWPQGTPSWVDISVPDVDGARAFYGSVLGWSFVDTGAEYGNYQMCQVNGRNVAGIGPKQASEQPTVWLVYLASDDVDATVKLINDNGGAVLFGPEDVGDAGRIAVARDNTGGVFGVWQGKQAIGIEHYNEPGGLVWEDCKLTDPDAGRAFYAAVFGYEYQSVPGAPDDYKGFVVKGQLAGGIGPLVGAPEGTPSHWLAYFSVANADTAASAARNGGGGVVMEPESMPFGRIGVLSDPFGAIFGVHSALPES